MPEGLVQVRPIKLLDLEEYTILGECQQNCVPTLSNSLCALEHFLATVHHALANVNKRGTNTKFTTRVVDGGLRKSFYNFHVL